MSECQAVRMSGGKDKAKDYTAFGITFSLLIKSILCVCIYGIFS